MSLAWAAPGQQFLQLPGDDGRNRRFRLFCGLGLFCRFFLRVFGFCRLEDGKFAVQYFDPWLRQLQAVLCSGANRGDFFPEYFQFLRVRCRGGSELFFESFECGLRLWQGIRLQYLRCLRRDQQPQQHQGP